ncbi:hypothetical protein LCGC14_0692150 [marine sediment metagenome]|uniref:Uncharacterized protein n=1 Tax=marine sediment metagenome TaxID=412755 RepID=A0A0F9QK95_9ZZZZ
MEGKMKKKSILFLGMFIICVVILISTIMVGPTIAAETGQAYNPPRALNSLLVVGGLGSLVLFALTSQKTRKR